MIFLPALIPIIAIAFFIVALIVVIILCVRYIRRKHSDISVGSTVRMKNHKRDSGVYIVVAIGRFGTCHLSEVDTNRMKQISIKKLVIVNKGYHKQTSYWSLPFLFCPVCGYQFDVEKEENDKNDTFRCASCDSVFHKTPLSK